MKQSDVSYPRLTLPYFVASGFYSGNLSPKAKGTVGSLAALIIGVLIYQILGIHILWIGVLFFGVIGTWAIQKIEDTCGPKSHDASIFVIDEWCGQWFVLAVAIWMCPEWGLFWQTIISFSLFRFFDVVKPFPVRQIDAKLSGGLGVMLDDVAAAGMGIVTLWVVSSLF